MATVPGSWLCAGRNVTVPGTLVQQEATRRDGEEFLRLAPTIPIRTETQAVPLQEANEALARLREGRLQAAAVVVP